MRRMNELRVAMHGSAEDVARFFDREEFEVEQMTGAQLSPDEVRANLRALKGDLNGV